MQDTETLMQAQPGLVRTLEIWAIGLLLVLLVLRPMSRQVVAALSQPEESKLLRVGAAGGFGAVGDERGISAGASGQAVGHPSGPGHAAGRMGGAPPMWLSTSGRATQSQGIYEQVSQQIRREPAQSTRLLETWIGEPVEETE